MTKTTSNSPKTYQHSKSAPMIFNKQQSMNSKRCSQNQLNTFMSINEENLILAITRKKFLWSRSASKDG